MTDTSATERAENAADSAVERSGEVAQTAKDAATAVADEARQQAGVVADEMKEQARHLVEETRTQLRETADNQAQNVARSLETFADELRALVNGQPGEAGSARRYVDMAGDTIADLASRMRSRDLDAVVRDVQQFARRRPGAFLAAAAGAGFVFARIARNSSQDSDESPPSGETAQRTATRQTYA